MLDIQNLGLVELNAQEIQEVEGGDYPVLDQIMDFCRGFYNGWHTY